MKIFGKRPLPYRNRILLVALILLAGAGAAFAAARPEVFRAGVSSAVEWMKFDMLANAATPSSGAEPQAPASSAPASSSAPSSSAPAASSEAEAREVSLEQAVKPLKVEVSLKEQKVSVLDARDRVVQEYVCSSGEAGSETPTGTFTVTDRGKSFYNPKVGEGAYYWTRFYKSYLFHSVPFDKNEKLEPQGTAKLGTPASHGCIRLPIEDAKWIYDHIPEGTQVVIR